MFYSSYVFDQDLSHFDVSKVTIFGAFMCDSFGEVAPSRFLTLP
jgi:surface protein